jgi:hypothetical protein
MASPCSERLSADWPVAERQHCFGCDDSQAKLQSSKLEKSGKQLANDIIAHLDHHYVRQLDPNVAQRDVPPST